VCVSGSREEIESLHVESRREKSRDLVIGRAQEHFV
jgi:hypothetical protein